MSIYKPEFCVYHTTYSGDLMPPNYIGSSSIKKVKNGYHGSVSSSKYKKIWESELKLHPELFHTVITSYHETRQEALKHECEIQKIFNVIKNPLFINMAYAATNGFFGIGPTEETLQKRIKTINNSTWRETKGKDRIKKHKETVNNSEWIDTIGKESIKKQLKTKSNPEWIETIGKNKIEKQKNKINSKEWKNTTGKDISAKLSKLWENEEWKNIIVEKRKNTINDLSWKNTIGKERAKKISDSKKGIPRSNETKQKLSEFMMGESNPFRGKPKNFKKVECPHCNKMISINNVKRYHLGNCKSRLFPLSVNDEN